MKVSRCVTLGMLALVLALVGSDVSASPDSHATVDDAAVCDFSVVIEEDGETCVLEDDASTEDCEDHGPPGCDDQECYDLCYDACIEENTPAFCANKCTILCC